MIKVHFRKKTLLGYITPPARAFNTPVSLFRTLANLRGIVLARAGCG
jgi:hypothetical protein